MGQRISKIRQLKVKKITTRNTLAAKYMRMYHIPEEIIDWILIMVIEIPRGQSLDCIQSMKNEEAVPSSFIHVRYYGKIIMNPNQSNQTKMRRIVIKLCRRCGNTVNFGHDAAIRQQLMNVQSKHQLYIIIAKMRRFCHCDLSDFYDVLIQKRLYDDDDLAIIFRRHFQFSLRRTLRWTPHPQLGGEPFLWPNGANYYF